MAHSEPVDAIVAAVVAGLSLASLFLLDFPRALRNGEYDNVGTSNGFNRTVVPFPVPWSISWLIRAFSHPHELSQLASHVVTTGWRKHNQYTTHAHTHTRSEAVMLDWNASNGIAWHITHTPRGALSNKYKFRQHDLPAGLGISSAMHLASTWKHEPGPEWAAAHTYIMHTYNIYWRLLSARARVCVCAGRLTFRPASCQMARPI